MKKLLIDTHVLLWWAEAPDRLADEARLAIGSGRNTLFFSHASLWELWIKIAAGKLRLPEPPTSLLQRARCRSLPITADHIEATAGLPQHHGDPFDRMLVAQAVYENMVLVTRDQKIAQYDVTTLAA